MASVPQGEKRREFLRRGDGDSKKGGHEGKGDGQTPNGFNRLAGVRDRCVPCAGEYHLALDCPPRGKYEKGPEPSPRSRNKSLRPAYFRTSGESTERVRNDGSSVNNENKNIRERSFPRLWIWEASLFAWVGTVWMRWMPAPQAIWRVSGIREIII